MNKKLDLDALVTRRYPLLEINQATMALKDGQILGRAILDFGSASQGRN
jgi:Zn-dependent alcohol dehydrogenase